MPIRSLDGTTESRAVILRLTTGLLAWYAGAMAYGQTQSPITIESALVRIIDSVNVPAPESGPIESIEVQEGSLVKRGDTLLKIDSQRQAYLANQSEIAAAIAKMQAESELALSLSQKTHALAQTELERVHGINRRVPNTIPQSEVDRLQLEVERTALEIQKAQQQQAIARLEHEKAQSELAAARHAVVRRTVVSPLDGMAVRIDKRPGEWVTEGETVLRIVRIDRLRAEAFLPVQLATEELVHCPATLSVLVAGQKSYSIRGSVSFVDIEADPVNNQVRIWVDFDKTHASIRPGLSGTLVLHSDQPVDTPPTSEQP